MAQYVIRGGKLGYERLQVLARSWQLTTSALLDRAGPGPGMSCLDLGCGGGDVTFELARRAAPGGSATGIDMDEVKLGLARQAAAAQGISNVAFRAQDIYAWAEPGRYDLVYCRNVLQHLTAEAIIREGIASAGQVQAALASLAGFVADPGSVCGSPRLFQAWSRRPVG